MELPWAHEEALLHVPPLEEVRDVMQRALHGQFEEVSAAGTSAPGLMM